VQLNPEGTPSNGSTLFTVEVGETAGVPTSMVGGGMVGDGPVVDSGVGETAGVPTSMVGGAMVGDGPVVDSGVGDGETSGVDPALPIAISSEIN